MCDHSLFSKTCLWNELKKGKKFWIYKKTATTLKLCWSWGSRIREIIKSKSYELHNGHIRCERWLGASGYTSAAGHGELWWGILQSSGGKSFISFASHSFGSLEPIPLRINLSSVYILRLCCVADWMRVNVMRKWAPYVEIDKSFDFDKQVVKI